jgi:hypothetical protein
MMTITSRFTGDAEFYQNVVSGVAAIPVGVETPVAGCSGGVVKKVSRRKMMVNSPTGVVWRGIDVTLSIRHTPQVGLRGNGATAVHGNFRNCIPFSAGNRGAKIFLSGSIQGWGFTSVCEFHSFMATLLEAMGDARCIESETRVALCISDAYIPGASEAPLLMRALAHQCSAHLTGREHVDYNPDEFAGLKIKLLHPTIAGKLVSVLIRAKGSVKVYLGNPGDVETDTCAVWSRVRQIMASSAT